MKVYVLVHEYQFDSGECGLETYVYDSLEKAQKELEKFVKDAEISWDEFFDTDYEKEQNEIRAAFFETGEYCYNHENITIYERDVL